MHNEIMLETKNLKKYFSTKSGMLHAVDDVNISIHKGETLGVVGESGCGKSTLGRTVIRLLDPTSGQIIFDGKDISGLSNRQMRQIRSNMQIVFQDPYASLGGGRRQRVGIARAIATNPAFMVLDEPVSALDVSIQAQILNLLMELQRKNNFTYLFISHDLSVVKHISDRIAVMYLGKIVEMAEEEELFDNPLHPYTQALLSAVPVPNIDAVRNRIILEGDVTSPIDPKPGCRFASRCQSCMGDCCLSDTPELKEVSKGHFVACHLC